MNLKENKYERLYTQIAELVMDKPNAVSRMATIAAVLHHKMKGFFWTGFYLLDRGELMVGPYQGPLACIRLKAHTGVCWAGVDTQKSVVVGNVHEFPGHIACSSLSNSEIVVPVWYNGALMGVLDIDSREYTHFDEADRTGLEKIVSLTYLGL